MAAAVSGGSGGAAAAAGSAAARERSGGPAERAGEPEPEAKRGEAALPGFDDADAFVKVWGGGGAGRGRWTTSPGVPCAARAVAAGRFAREGAAGHAGGCSPALRGCGAARGRCR